MGWVLLLRLKLKPSKTTNSQSPKGSETRNEFHTTAARIIYPHAQMKDIFETETAAIVSISRSHLMFSPHNGNIARIALTQQHTNYTCLYHTVQYSTHVLYYCGSSTRLRCDFQQTPQCLRCMYTHSSPAYTIVYTFMYLYIYAQMRPQWPHECTKRRHVQRPSVLRITCGIPNVCYSPHWES